MQLNSKLDIQLRHTILWIFQVLECISVVLFLSKDQWPENGIVASNQVFALIGTVFEALGKDCKILESSFSSVVLAQYQKLQIEYQERKNPNRIFSWTTLVCTV